MEAVTYTHIRNNFSKTMDRVCNDHSPVIVTRQTKKPVVVISLEDFNSIEETLYLTRSPQNTAMLLKSMEQIETGEVVKKTIQDLEKIAKK